MIQINDNKTMNILIYFYLILILLEKIRIVHFKRFRYWDTDVAGTCYPFLWTPEWVKGLCLRSLGLPGVATTATLQTFNIVML